jgi:hypothetical protein
MQVSDLYLQRAVECERMALQNPQQREALKGIAKTWRWLAKAAHDLEETVKTFH